MGVDSLALFWARKLDDFLRGWYKFSRNPLSIAGLIIFILILVGAVFAPQLAPYPEHAGPFVDFASMNQPPSLKHLFGTDLVGRDIFSRILFGYRFSLRMGVFVLALAVPFGVTLGLVAGYYKETWVDVLIMRITDIFLSVPPLILALVVTAFLTPNLTNAMLAITIAWWPWYTRMIYGLAGSLARRSFVQAAEALGASKFHILFKEILPNCISPILTKMTLDMAFVVLMGATLSFVGLGVQPPKPGLGTMVAEGAKYMPSVWWLTVTSAFAIMLLVMSLNIMGDGLRDTLAVEEI